MTKLLSVSVLISLFLLSACSKDAQTEVEANAKSMTKVAKETGQEAEKKLEAKTISIKEVSRIAIVEAKQYISELTKTLPDVDASNVHKYYKKANTLFGKGEYKKAQEAAVEVRHAVEKLLIKAKK